jgi:uncharacterized protein (DUF952 family)
MSAVIFLWKCCTSRGTSTKILGFSKSAILKAIFVNMPAIFHIAERAQWETAQAEGAYWHPSLETEGFIHCSTAEQVVWVANTFFRGQSGLVLLELDPEALATLQFDPVEGVGVFPHVYGTIDLKAIVQVFEFEPNQDGEFALPSEVSSETVE